MRYFTGIGSRKTPDHVQTLMKEISHKYTKGDWCLRSGGADSADEAFRSGVTKPEKSEIFLPWNNYNSLRKEDAGMVLVTNKEILQYAERIASTVHPNWQACSAVARALHTRNVFQVLGPTLDTPSDVLICWAKPVGTGISGGTATAWNLAKQYKVPCFNLHVPLTFQKFVNFIRVEI